MTVQIKLEDLIICPDHLGKRSLRNEILPCLQAPTAEYFVVIVVS